MAVDTPRVQRGIAKWSLLATILIGGISYFFGLKQLAFGLVFGVGLCIINYRVVSVILDVAFKLASPDLARVISFASYHVRFWLIVIILYIVIPRTHYLFALGTFMGLLLPKMIMGVYVVRYTEEEWWNNEAEAPQADSAEVEVEKPKDLPEGIRFPGLDFDERYQADPRFNDPDSS
ncbi:hypothetical protein [Phosphitispora fastidiosa]|uniref:hypothetical protein n=1 Tax=Phosphitispora fastidiosa TaxID=2837202 RepID=UPI001E5EE207|nr:hypothetical protein [Phosphitispora fastidiosa]MBU7007360.1 hypothetical protein [Phosphitispora fastidiosa]